MGYVIVHLKRTEASPLAIFKFSTKCRKPSVLPGTLTKGFCPIQKAKSECISWIVCKSWARCACVARVMVVGFVCVFKSHISPLERLFDLISMSCTQWATKIKIFVGVSLKLLRCGDPDRRPFFTHGRYTYEHAHTSPYAPRVCTSFTHTGRHKLQLVLTEFNSYKWMNNSL